MNKKQFTLIESSLTGTDKGHPYSYEEYVEYCNETQQEAAPEDSQEYWDWVTASIDVDFGDFFVNLKHSKADKEGHYIVKFNLGLWDGHREGYMKAIYNSISTAIKDALYSSSSYMDYEVIFDNGEVIVNCYHHDGTNVFTIKKLSKHGERNLLDKDEPNFEKYLNNKDTFKKLDWQFAWT